MSFNSLEPPRSLLGRHRVLSPTAGVRVSPLCLGSMNFGESWKQALGECTKETAFAMLDYFYEQGGNFVDTAVNYQSGESEQWIGEWMEVRGRRDEMVIATKFTGQQSAAEQRQKEGKFKEQGVMKDNYSGNSAKNIHTSIERSLKNLRTTYLDIVSTPLSIFAVVTLMPPVLRAPLGLYHLSTRVDAHSPRPLHRTQSHLPRDQRYACLDRSQSKRLCSPARSSPILYLPRSLVCCLT